MTTDTDSQAAIAPLWSDEDIHNASMWDWTHETYYQATRSALEQMRHDYQSALDFTQRLAVAKIEELEANHARAASRIAELEMDSIYLHEVASPAIGIFQQRDRIQKASIEALQQRVDLLEAQLTEALTQPAAQSERAGG